MCPGPPIAVSRFGAPRLLYVGYAHLDVRKLVRKLKADAMQFVQRSAGLQ
jgi:hypothetical protein